MTDIFIPIRYPNTKPTEIYELGNLSVGAQLAITAGVSLATTAITAGFQYMMHKDKQKADEKRIREEQARAEALAREAKAEEERIRKEQQALQQQLIKAQQQQQKVQTQQRKQLLWGGLAVAGAGVLLFGLIFLMKK